MKVCFVCGYWSDLTIQVFGKRPEDYWNAHFYVWAVKVGSHRRKFYVRTRAGTKHTIDKANFGDARTLFGRFVARKVEDNGWGEGVLVVPVPSKDALLDAEGSRALSMVSESLAKTPLNESISDALRWTKKLARAHERGERRREELRPFLRVVADVKRRDVVLVDDLLTRGGNMLAAKDALEAAGATVVGAVTCGHTMYDRATKAFGDQDIELIAELDDFGRAAAKEN